MQTRGVTRGSGTAEADTAAAAPVATAVVPKPKKGKASFAARNAAAASAAVLVGELDTPSSEVLQATVAALEHIPTAMELAADPADLAIIREVFGSRAQTLINSLLAFDAYFNWYYPLKLERIALFAPIPVREQYAFQNMTTAIDMCEIFERVSIRNHKSFLIHGAVYKVTRDILHVGDSWSFCLSALELQNAETKRVASSCAAKNLTQRVGGEARLRPLSSGVEGPAQLVHTRGYSTTMALSTLNHLLVAQKLRSGNGLSDLAAIPLSRRAQRLMHDGRTKGVRSSVKLEMPTVPGYDPRRDTCIKAFVRLLAMRASQGQSSQ
jgi:hypothetical protein